MVDLDQYRNKICEVTAALKNKVIELPYNFLPKRNRWRGLPLLVGVGLLASACASGYPLEKVGDHLDDTQLAQSSGVMKSVSFWLDSHYTVDGSYSGSLVVKVCFNGQGNLELVSEQISGTPGPGFLFAGHYPFNSDCTSDFARFGNLYPVTDLGTPEEDKVYVGVSGTSALRTYKITRTPDGLTGNFLGTTDVDEPIKSREGYTLTP